MRVGASRVSLRIFVCAIPSVISFGLLGALKWDDFQRIAMYVRDIKNSNGWMQFCSY